MTTRQLPLHRRSGGFRRPQSPLDRDIDLVSLDVFGLTLDRLVVHPADVHRLVALSLAQGGIAVAGVYPALRIEAEQRAAAAARAGGRRTIALADITEHLEAGLAPLVPDPRPVARLAVEREVALELRLSQPSLQARALIEEAGARGLPVAFVADTYLPRDLVALMLRSAGLPAWSVLVSSHEGVTKYDGQLFRHLAERTDVDPSRILHLGPDPAVDVVMAQRVGLQALELASPAREAVATLRRGMWPVSALDSVALALAARQHTAGVATGALTTGPSGTTTTGAVTTGSDADPLLGHALDLGYCVGGPLAVGFAAWVGTLVDQRQPHHVLLCGPIGPVVRELLIALRPDLAPHQMHVFPPAAHPHPAVDGGAMTAARFDQMTTGMRLVEGDRILAVELGWPEHLGLAVGRAVHDRFRRVDVQVACMGRVRPPLGWERDTIWAFTGASHDPTTAIVKGRLADLEAVLGLTAADSRRGGERYRRAAPAIAEGIARFAHDFGPWFRLDPSGTSPALVEPALRVLECPDPIEAGLLADASTGGHGAGPDGPASAPPGGPGGTTVPTAAGGGPPGRSSRDSDPAPPARRPAGRTSRRTLQRLFRRR